MFPSLPVSTLYGTIIETWFNNGFRFAVITHLFTIENNTILHSPCQYDLLLHGVGMGPVLGHG